MTLLTVHLSPLGRLVGWRTRRQIVVERSCTMKKDRTQVVVVGALMKVPSRLGKVRSQRQPESKLANLEHSWTNFHDIIEACTSQEINPFQH